MADINMGMSEALRAEMANITSTQRAAVLMLLLGEEQAADIIGLLWREHRRTPKPDNKHTAQIEFAKNKNGACDTVRLWFDGATQRFEDEG